MGASESTSRSNGTKKEEEENSSVGAAAAIATAAAGVVFTAWGISKMLSDNTQERDHHVTEQPLSLNSRDGIKQRSRWSPPPPGRFKINTDGACRPVRGKSTGCKRGPSGYGGILRDHYGNWVQGFIGFIGHADCLTAEFHGILKGLELLDNLKLKGAVLETDSQPAYEWIARPDDGRGKSEIIHEVWDIIVKCRQLARKNKITINLIPRDDGNKCADKLADMGINEREPYLAIKVLPYKLKDLVKKDANFNA